MKTEQDVMAAVETFKDAVDRLTADLSDTEKEKEANRDDIWRCEELENDIKRLSYQIAINKEWLKALEWVLKY